MLTFRDKSGRIIRLTNERIKHISYHMLLNDKIHIIEDTLKYPNILSKDEEREDKLYCQRYLKNEDLYFVIAAKIFNGEGFIITIYKSRKLKE